MLQMFRRWLQIKQIKKLCYNNSVPKRGLRKYNPIYKYKYNSKCIVNNVDFSSKKSKLDLSINKTSFATASPAVLQVRLEYNDNKECLKY